MIVVVADDITGAAEIAGVCLRYGLSVSFFVDTVIVSTADVCVIATDSRSLTEQEAFDCHAKLANDIQLLNPDLIFKKCDSVLRGFVLTELLPLIDIGNFSNVLLMPSNPSVGRCIRSGNYYVGDRLISDTGFSGDPDFPAKSSEVRTLLEERSPLALSQFNIATDLPAVGHGNVKTNVIVPDCSTRADMLHALEAVHSSSFLAGSALFFEQILIHNGFAESVGGVELRAQTKFFLVAGTAHPDSRAFGAKLSENGCRVVSFPDGLLCEAISAGDLDAWISELAGFWKNSPMLSLTIADRPVVFHDSKEQLKLRLSTVVAQLITQCEISEVFIEGGATTYHILRYLGCVELMPVGELAPGVLRLKVVGRNLFITIKPGSYTWPAGLFLFL